MTLRDTNTYIENGKKVPKPLIDVVKTQDEFFKEWYNPELYGVLNSDEEKELFEALKKTPFFNMDYAMYKLNFEFDKFCNGFMFPKIAKFVFGRIIRIKVR